MAAEESRRCVALRANAAVVAITAAAATKCLLQHVECDVDAAAGSGPVALGGAQRLRVGVAEKPCGQRFEGHGRR